MWMIGLRTTCTIQFTAAQTATSNEQINLYGFIDPLSARADSCPLVGIRGDIGYAEEYASIASLPMPPVLATRLKTYLASKHYRPNGLGLLFANRRGRTFSANKLREKKLRPLITTLSLGIPLAGFHAFRHGVATTLIDRGASITTVGAQLRHSDPRITLGLYAHVVPQSQRDAVEGLANAVSSGQLGKSFVC
jgi:integrase